MQGTQQTLRRHGFTQVKRFPADTGQRRSWESHGFPLLLGREKPRVFPPAPKYCTWSGRADKPRVLQQKTSFSKNTDMTQTKVFPTPHFFPQRSTKYWYRWIVSGAGTPGSQSLLALSDRPSPFLPHTPPETSKISFVSLLADKYTAFWQSPQDGEKKPSFINYMPAIDCVYKHKKSLNIQQLLLSEFRFQSQIEQNISIATMWISHFFPQTHSATL